MDRLRYFEYIDGRTTQIILYNPAHITTYQARSAACYQMCFWVDSTAGGEILRIDEVDKFYRTFRSVLPYLEKCEPLDGAIAGARQPEDMERLKSICEEMDAREQKQAEAALAELAEEEVFLRFIREPAADGRGYATAFDIRDVKDLFQAQLGSERYIWLDTKQAYEKSLHDALCRLSPLESYDKVFAGSDLPWLREEKNHDTVVEERERANKSD